MIENQSKFSLRTKLFAILIAAGIAVTASGCAADPDVDEEGEIGAEEDGEIGETSEALTSCGNLCSVGGVFACARFGLHGGIFCGLTSVAACATVCSSRGGACRAGERKVFQQQCATSGYPAIHRCSGSWVCKRY